MSWVKVCLSPLLPSHLTSPHTLSYQLNTLHWHVVDSQSFPIQVPAYPEISAHGAYDHTQVYKPTDVEDLVKFANERGVDIIPVRLSDAHRIQKT